VLAPTHDHALRRRGREPARTSSTICATVRPCAIMSASVQSSLHDASSDANPRREEPSRFSFGMRVLDHTPAFLAAT
jgi:hypothetical protein